MRDAQFSLDWLRYDDRSYADLGVAYVFLLLRRGASLNNCWGGAPAEACLRHIEDPSAFPHLVGAYGGAVIPSAYGVRRDDGAYDGTKDHFIACKRLVADTRRQRFVLPRKQFLTLRSLVIRQRAKTKDPLLNFVIGLPDGVAWNVLSFWRGSRDAKVAASAAPVLIEEGGA